MIFFLLGLLSMCCFAMPAYAYIGPGPGLSMLGSLFTLIGGVFLAFVLTLLYPIRLLRRRMRARRDGETKP